MSDFKQLLADATVSPTVKRREFLQRLGAAATAAWMTGAPQAFGAHQATHPVPQADACILLWMAGGMAAPETFDPKRYAPFEKGMAVDSVLSTFPAIDTTVDNIKFCKGLEALAGVMDRGALVRSVVQPDLGSILHSRHQFHWHTGYVPPVTVAAPHIGAWMARVLGPRNPVMPAFINIGQRLEGIGEKEELKAFTTGGFFGSEFGPLNLPFPEQAAAAVRPPEALTPTRFTNRDRLLRRLVEASPHREYASDYHRESVMRSLDNAYRLLSSDERQAFEIDREPKAVRDRYDTGRFGRGCLLARRLVEAGARFIEVSTEYVPFLHWDTHAEGHATTERLHKEIDRPIAQLILDLEERGLLDRTLVVVASEFSRDALVEGKPGSDARDQATHKVDEITEPKHYGLHRHFTGGSSVLLFGGGTPRGMLYGKTADERPLVAVENPVSIDDLLATIYTKMGVNPKTAFDIEKRPFYATLDGKGVPVQPLLN